MAKVNVDDEPELAAAFKVTGIPTLYALKDGQVKAQMVGFGGKAKIEGMFEELSGAET